MQDEDVYTKYKLLFSSFVGSLVEVVAQSGDQSIQLRGVLLDYDSRFLYLGANIEEITTAVNIDRVTLIAYENELGEIHEALQEMGEPEGEMDLN